MLVVGVKKGLVVTFFYFSLLIVSAVADSFGIVHFFFHVKFS